MNPNSNKELKTNSNNVDNSAAKDKIQDVNRKNSGDALARANNNKPNLGSRIPSKSSSLDNNKKQINGGSTAGNTSNNALNEKRNQARQALAKKGIQAAATPLVGPGLAKKIARDGNVEKLKELQSKKYYDVNNPLKNRGVLSKISGDQKKDKENSDLLKGKNPEKSEGEEAMKGFLKISLKVLRIALFLGPMSALIVLFTVLTVATINDEKVSSMILAGASADESEELRSGVSADANTDTGNGNGSYTLSFKGKGDDKYPAEYYERLAKLGNNYSSQKECKGKECLSTSEFLYYLKIADIKTRYEKKYSVSLDWFLISATNLYKDESTEDIMKANIGGYDRNSVDNIDTLSGLDWENDFKNISGYQYLDRDDSTYDLQILAKNMVTKKTVQKCVNSSGSVTKQQEDKDIEDIYLAGDRKLECSSNETYSINSTYEKDEEKFKEFMLEYIDKKMYSFGSGNTGNHMSSCTVTTNGAYIWPIGSTETTTGKDKNTYALGTPELGKANISRGYSSGHKGLDIHSNSRINVVNVVASKSGTVVYPTSKKETSFPDTGNSSDGGGYGNYVKIKHDDGTYTLYGHMAQNSITVTAGDKVGAGQVIGKVGHSGDSTGAHLHFEVRDANDNRLDPQKYVNADNPRAGTTEKCDSGGNSLADSMVKLAVSQLKDPQAKDGEKYWKWIGKNQRIEWCATFVSWVVANTEYNGEKLSSKINHKSPSVQTWINYFNSTNGLKYVHNDNCSKFSSLNGSTKKYTPKPGDLIFFDWNGDWTGELPATKRASEHVGIVERTENGKIITIEGNSDNKVAERSYSLDSCDVIGFGSWY